MQIPNALHAGRFKFLLNNPALFGEGLRLECVVLRPLIALDEFRNRNCLFLAVHFDGVEKLFAFLAFGIVVFRLGVVFRLI